MSETTQNGNHEVNPEQALEGITARSKVAPEKPLSEMSDEELAAWHIALRQLQNPTTLRAFLDDSTKVKQSQEPPPLFNADDYT